MFTGDSKQKSKQAAAYRALEFGYPHLLGEIKDEYMPDLSYNPICLSFQLLKYPLDKNC